MRRSATLYVLALVALSFLPLAAAQESSKSASSAPTFTARTDLVMVPAVVTSRNGVHISGLKASDFTLLQDGKPARIAVFEEIVASPKYSKPQARSLPPLTYTNAQENRTPRPLVILALDAINTPMQDRMYAREQLAKYLDGALDDNAMVAFVVMTRSGVHLVHDFTTNASVLSAALKQATAGATPAAVDALQADDQAALMREVADLSNLDHLSGGFAIAGEMRLSVLSTMRCLTQIAQAYGGVPGRKALVWVTAGFPFTLNDSAELTVRNRNLTADGLSMVEDDYEHAWQMLNDANFSLYTVDARGLVNPSFLSAEFGARTGDIGAQARQRIAMQTAIHNDRLATFRAFADMTGGRAFVNNNDLTRGFRAAVEETSAYYLLGFYRDKTITKPGWHKLKVKVAKDAEVRARAGYLVPRDAPAKTEDEQRRNDIRLALYPPMQFSALPLKLRLLPNAVSEAPPAGMKYLPFEVEAAVSGLNTREGGKVSLSLAGVVRDSAGRDVADVDKTFTGNVPGGHDTISLREVFTLPRGRYTARVVVRDNYSGHTGSVIIPVVVE